MSIIKTIPKSSRFIQVDIDFLSTFNDPTLGKYNFDIPANRGVVLLEPVNRTSVYLIDRYSFSATIPDGTYLEAVETTPTAQLRKRIDGIPIYQKPIPCINYIDNAEALAYFWSFESAIDQAQQDAVIIDFRGILGQPADLRPRTSIL